MNLRWSLDAAYDPTRYKHLIVQIGDSLGASRETGRPREKTCMQDAVELGWSVVSRSRLHTAHSVGVLS